MSILTQKAIRRRLEVTGPPAPLLDGVARETTSGAVHFAVSREGTLVYVPAGAPSEAAAAPFFQFTLSTQVEPGSETVKEISSVGGTIELLLFEASEESVRFAATLAIDAEPFEPGETSTPITGTLLYQGPVPFDEDTAEQDDTASE